MKEETKFIRNKWGNLAYFNWKNNGRSETPSNFIQWLSYIAGTPLPCESIWVRVVQLVSPRCCDLVCLRSVYFAQMVSRLSILDWPFAFLQRFFFWQKRNLSPTIEENNADFTWQIEGSMIIKRNESRISDKSAFYYQD